MNSCFRSRLIKFVALKKDSTVARGEIVLRDLQQEWFFLYEQWFFAKAAAGSAMQRSQPVTQQPRGMSKVCVVVGDSGSWWCQILAKSG